MAATIGVVFFIIGLLASVALHEVGHMVPAKKFGVRVSQYMVGFGPTLWSRKRGETEYGLKAIPLGGYVRLIGMIPPAEAVKPVRGTGWYSRIIEESRRNAVEEMEPGDDARAFYRLAWWKKVIVMAGGPVMNLIIATVILVSVPALYGIATPTPVVADVVPCVQPGWATEECGAGDPVSPASAAGLREGDQIVAINGAAIGSWSDARDYFADHPLATVSLTILRDGDEIVVPVQLAARQTFVRDDAGQQVAGPDGEPLVETVGFLGMYSTWANEKQSVGFGFSQVGLALSQTAGAIIYLPESAYHAARAALGYEERSAEGALSIFGAGRIAGDIASEEGRDVTFADRAVGELTLLALINVALFVFNMVPLPPLDGGHIASALWQAVRNGWARVRSVAVPSRPVDVARLMPLAYGMFVVLIGLGLVLIWADAVAPVSV